MNDYEIPNYRLTKTHVLEYLDQIEKWSKKDSEKAHIIEEQLKDHFIESAFQFGYTDRELRDITAAIRLSRKIDYTRYFI